MSQRHSRVVRDTPFELTRSGDSADGTGRTLSGYAAVFGADTEIRSWEGNFIERLAKGSFRNSIRDNPNPLMQWDHGRDSRVGTTPIGKYTTLREDAQGLYVEGELFDNPVVEPVRQAIEAGAVTGMSFAFVVIRDEWRDNKGNLIRPAELRELLYDAGDRGPIRRTIKEVRMSEAGPVGRPAYKQTSVGVRSAATLSQATADRIIRLLTLKGTR
ncbi:HK97 family phage prohead protease [Rhodococcus sp. 1R11]|uniref:HK97 family phage prohead protease n=1 Tax=Rhodococcus sp. 1R11 TaxID=2559614 RepID=UPI001072EA94|nr:HK97 family phage prohead protease [Rhodococcus sp. 1R11]TFI45154.1 HK97 family phage prohead protease [Rhodococcus sp. 1R11]